MDSNISRQDTLKDKYGIVCSALRNQKSRFFLPGKNNTFNDIPCERVMFDTGCNTILLPLPIQLNYEDFFQKYKYDVRSISYSGSVNSPTLVIQTIPSVPFKIKFENSNNVFDSKKLRFHLSLEDAQVFWLMRKVVNNSLKKVLLKILTWRN